MADYKTHITVSTGLGIAYGTWGYMTCGLSFEHCAIATGLCSVAGMLPDLDSDSSVPQREMLSLIAVLSPVLMLPRFHALEMTPEQIVFASGFVYLFVRFVIGAAFQKYTKHRGMWHSIPAAFIAGLATYLLCHCSDFEIRIFKAWAVVIGFVSHLVLDEIFAVNWAGKRIKIKSSFGSALKLFSPSPGANLLTYTKLIVLIGLVCGDHYAMSCIVCDDHGVVKTATDYVKGILDPASESPTVMR